MPATIVVAHGLLSPMPVYGRRFSAVGERVNAYSYMYLCTYMNSDIMDTSIDKKKYFNEVENTPICSG